MTDAELLEQHRAGSPDAFGELVRRHADWVWCLARRLVRGDAHLADEVTQATFMVLARKPPRLKPDQALSPWLFPVTNYAAKQILRAEHRRRIRETEAAKMRDTTQNPQDDPWNELAEMLDELVARLRNSDRQAILLRFYERKSFPEIGLAMRITEEAARKRVSRAIDQLRGLFARRGVTVGAAALSGAMSANLATHSASAAAIASAAGGAQAVTPVLKGVNALLWWMTLKPLALAATVLLSVGTVALVVQVSLAQRSAAVAPTTAPTTAPVAVARFGVVLSPDDKPVAGAKVWQVQFMLESRQYRLVGSATTNERGRFELPLLDERAKLLMKAPGFAWSGGYIRSTDREDPDEVRIQPPTSLRLKFVGPDDKPAVGVPVRITWAGDSRVDAIFPEDFAEPAMAQKTDADGMCSFAALPQGAKAYLNMADERFAKLDYNDRAELGRSDTTDGGVIHLKPAAAISGKVVFGDTGKAVQGVQVRAENEGNGRGSGTTNVQGHYDLKQLPPGRYHVSVELPAEISRHYAVGVVERLMIAPGMHVDNQDFALVSGGIVRGRITEKETGKPLQGLNVWVAGPSTPDLYTSSNEHLGPQVATSDEDGMYLIHATPGAHYVQFWSRPPPPGFSEPRPLSHNIQVGENQTSEVNFELPHTYTTPLKGRTVDSTGHPLGGVEIYAQPQNESPPGKMVAVSDTAGNFSLPPIDPASRLRGRRGRWTTIRSIPAAGQNLMLTLDRNALASIHLVVQQPDGKPMPGARVNVSDPLGNEIFDEKTTGPDGACLFKGLSPDLAYSISIWPAGHGIAEVNVQVQPGKQTDVPTIMLKKADSFVAGMVVDENGEPVADVTITMMAPHYGTSFRTDIGGHFRYPGLVPGDHVSFSATTDDHKLTGSMKNVAAGTDGVLITLHPPTTQPR